MSVKLIRSKREHELRSVLSNYLHPTNARVEASDVLVVLSRDEIDSWHDLVVLTPTGEIGRLLMRLTTKFEP